MTDPGAWFGRMVMDAGGNYHKQQISDQINPAAKIRTTKNAGAPKMRNNFCANKWFIAMLDLYQLHFVDLLLLIIFASFLVSVLYFFFYCPSIILITLSFIVLKGNRDKKKSFPYCP